MIQTINKGTDFISAIKLEDSCGIPYRVANTSEFRIKLYTTNPSQYVECYFDGTVKGILMDGRVDRIVVNSNELETLDSGLLKYIVSVKSPCAEFNDAHYDEVMKGETNYYLK